MKKFLLSLVSLFMLTALSWAGEPTKVLTFPASPQESVQGYDKTWTATVDGDVWTLYAFNNNQNGWKYVKCGWSKGATAATITSPTVDVAITDIVITVDNTKNVESATLTVYNDAQVVRDPIDITADFVAGDVHVAIPEPAAGYNYVLTIQNPKTSSNGTTQISKVALYEAGQYEAVEPVHIANTAETAYTVAEAYDLIDAGEALGDIVYVKGIVSQVDSYNDTYKSIQYWISDDGTTEKQLECYSGKGLDGADFASVDDVKVGAVVIVKGNLKKYNTIYELDKNNELVSYEHSYFTNPSFEYAAQGVPATAQALTNGGEFYGWTLPNLGTQYVNISIGSATECIGGSENGPGVSTPKDGDFYYFARHGWNGAGVSGTLSTTAKALPVGHYTLTFAYKAMDAYDDDNNKGADSYLTLVAKAGEQELASYQTPAFVKIKHPDYIGYFNGDANWLEAALSFNVKEAGDVTLEVVHNFKGVRRSDVVIDDVRLVCNGVVPIYTVAVAEGIENGTVVAAPAEASEGDIVTLTVTPAEGYVLETLAVMNGEEAVEVSEDNTFVMPAGDVVVTATFKEESPKDVTNLYLVNADLNSIDGWTRGGNVKEVTHRTDLDVNAVEFYHAWGANAGAPIGNSGDFSLTQKVTLPAGDYRIVVNAFYREGNGNGTNTKAYIFAGEKKQYVHAVTAAEQGNLSNGSGIYGNSKVKTDMGRAAYAFSIGDFENAFDFSVEQDDSEVELGFKGYIDTYCSWCILGPVKLYKYSLEDYLVAYREKVVEAEALYNNKMGAAELQALQAAVVDETTFSTGAQVTAALDVLNAAIAAAKKSIEGYEALTNALTQGETYKANTTNKEAVATYEAAIAEVKAAYEAGTVEDLDAALAIVNAALPALARAQTADNSDLTVFINNPEVNGADGWTDERPNGGNGPLLNGTAFEYWAGNANSRETACFDYYQVIEGLASGVYTLSAEMYNSLNGEGGAEFVPTCGVYAAADGVEVSQLVDVDGTELIRYTTPEITVMNGTLRIGVKNTVTPMAARWFVADNFKLTLVKYISPEDINYAAANEAMVSGKDYFVSSVMGDNTYYLKKDGYLTANKAEAGIFNIVSYPGNADTHRELGWRIPEFTNGGTNTNAITAAAQTHLIPGNQHRVDFETQVLYLNEDGNYAIRSTNSTSASWGAAAFWTVVEDNDADGLPNATYVMDEIPYVWNITPIESDARCVAYQKTQEWPSKLVAAWTSNAKEPTEGSFEALTDRNYATFFHSSWSVATNADHYLQAELPEAKNDLIFYFKKRSTNNNNRPTAITISASKDGETFTDITSVTEGLPTDANVIDYTSQKIDLGDSYNFLRFTVTATNTGQNSNGHVFFTFSEFYVMNGDVENYWNIADWTTLTDEDVANINALDDQLSAAQKAWAEKEEVMAIKMKAVGIYERIQAYAAGIGGEFEAKMALYAALETVDVDAPTTVEAANAVVRQLNEIAANFVASLSDVEDRNVTGAFLDNSTPTSNAEGWTIENGPATFDAGNDVAEFWNKSAASIKQTVFLPAGNYKLTAQAVTRSEMTALLVAGENQTDLVTMPSSGTQAGVDFLNQRTHVNTWFTAGNGWNEVEFTLDEAAEVEVGLLADATTGDHWLVWRSFVITKVGTHIDPNDMTALIVNPAYLGTEGSDDKYVGWNHTEDGWKERSYEAPMNLITYSGNCAFEVNQTIENVPAGLYRLSVHAFYRAGSLEDEQAKVAAGTELEKELVMYANVNDADNKYSQKVMNLSEGAAAAQVEGTGVEFAEGLYVPNSAADSRTWYIAGEYKNEVLFNVFEDGSVTIGLSKAVGLAGDYCPIGAWSLYRVGDADENEATPDPKPAVPASLALTTVTYDGQDVVFNEENVATIDGSYDAAKELVVVAEAGEAVSVEVAYPTEIGQDQIVITVADKDVENFPENKATYTIVFSVPTAINFINADEQTVIYDVTGRRVSKAVKGGLYIINGKKTLVK